MRTLTAGVGRGACGARAEDLAERGAEVGRAEVSPFALRATGDRLDDVLGEDLRGRRKHARQMGAGGSTTISFLLRSRWRIHMARWHGAQSMR